MMYRNGTLFTHSGGTKAPPYAHLEAASFLS